MQFMKKSVIVWDVYRPTIEQKPKWFENAVKSGEINIQSITLPSNPPIYKDEFSLINDENQIITGNVDDYVFLKYTVNESSNTFDAIEKEKFNENYIPIMLPNPDASPIIQRKEFKVYRPNIDEFPPQWFLDYHDIIMNENEEAFWYRSAGGTLLSFPAKTVYAFVQDTATGIVTPYTNSEFFSEFNVLE